MSDVLDLIDGAPASHDDAMRWRPPEAHVADRIDRLRQALTGFGQAMSSFGEEFAASLKRISDAVRLCRQQEETTRARQRLARMHSAYRRRR